MQNIKLFEELIAIDRKAELPVYLQIANAIIRNIRKGRFRKGLKFPGSRKMAELLQVNRMTMVAVYDELEAQGWIERKARKGTFVNSDFPDIVPRKIINEGTVSGFQEEAVPKINDKHIAVFPTSKKDSAGKLVFNDGFPDVRLAPVEALAQNMRSFARQPVFSKYLLYGRAQGTDVLCDTLTSFLSDTRGLPVSLENIMVTRGAQMGIFLTANLLLQQGDQVIVGEPGYFGANRTFEQQGAVLNRVPVDEAGMDVNAVEQVCKKKKIRLLYVIPHHHHPTTVTLTPRRRLRLLELAKKYKFSIIEDDYDYDFHYASSPMLPIASMDEHGSVIYIGTLTKTLAPGIRIGFMAGAGALIQAASNLRRSIDWQGDSLMEAAIAELYKDGSIARHIRKSVKLYRKRRDYFCHLLENKLGHRISFKIPDGGMSIWARFLDADLEKISQKAYKQGLVISNGKEYNTHTTNYNAIRMGFASLNFEEQERAIGILSKCI